ncbi:MAG: ATP-dependent zinc protease [Oleiphilus sp.]
MSDKDENLILGALEVCSLPELQITDLHVRVDTGAKTSSLHVDNIEAETREGEPWVSFDIHPDIHNVERVVRRASKLKEIRSIKSSNAAKEQRYVIETRIAMGGRSWPIEVTLTDRSSMSYLMLLGRQAMQNNILVNPSQEYLVVKPEPSE